MIPDRQLPHLVFTGNGRPFQIRRHGNPAQRNRLEKPEPEQKNEADKRTEPDICQAPLAFRPAKAKTKYGAKSVAMNGTVLLVNRISIAVPQAAPRTNHHRRGLYLAASQSLPLQYNTHDEAMQLQSGYNMLSYNVTNGAVHFLILILCIESKLRLSVPEPAAMLHRLFLSEVFHPFIISEGGQNRKRLICPMNKSGVFAGTGRRIRTLTDGVRVRRATFTQSRYAQARVIITDLSGLSRFFCLF